MINDIKNKIKSFFTKDKLERALLTFIECFCSYIAINIGSLDLSNTDAIKALIIGAIGSAISIVINSFKKSESVNQEIDDQERDEK